MVLHHRLDLAFSAHAKCTGACLNAIAGGELGAPGYHQRVEGGGRCGLKERSQERVFYQPRISVRLRYQKLPHPLWQPKRGLGR